MIQSPRYSFADFNGRLENVVLPAIDSMAVAFQFYLAPGDHTATSKSFGFGICDITGSTILHTFSNPVQTCLWGVMTGINLDTSFPLNVTGGPIPAGLYNSKDDVFDALQLAGVTANGETFLQCCDLSNVHNLSISTDKGSITIIFYAGVYQVTLTSGSSLWSSFPFLVLPGECFRYCIIDGGTIIPSNPFQREASPMTEHTWVTYSCNESAYDFSYGSPLNFNQNWLPLYTRNPKYPETRKVYLKSNKEYKVLSAIIEKSREVITNYVNENLHDRISVMLSHDNIHLTNASVDADVYKTSDYQPEDLDIIAGIPLSQAKCTVNQYFEGRNSNCDKRFPCTSFPSDGGGGGGGTGCTGVALAFPGVHLPDGQVGIAYNASIELTGDGPFAVTVNDAPLWMSPNITVAGSTVSFGGTPDVAATGLSVSITITNCEGANSIPFIDAIDVIEDTTAILTLKYITGSFREFSASLNNAIDGDVTITKLFADGFTAGSDCGSGAAASAQFNNTSTPFVISVGGTGATHEAESESVDWVTAGAVLAHTYNAIVNGSVVTDGSVITVGGYTVTVVIQQCSA